MITLSFDKLMRVTGGALNEASHGDQTFRGVSIDSRTLSPGELFVALPGERNDGHNYIDQAIERGAAGALLQSEAVRSSPARYRFPVVAVADSHQALIELAQHYRERVGARRVGITGSNGKTTTKEVAFRLLQAVQDGVFRSPGNYNNLYGMPLALLAMPQETKIALLEMGISSPGEMTRLAEIVRPDVMLITNVGPSHLEFLDSVEGVARAKLEVVPTMSADQPVIINADDDVLVRETVRLRKDYVSFGIRKPATFTPTAVKRDASGVTVVRIGKATFRLPLFGQYQVYNLLAAYAVVHTLGGRLDGVDTAALSFESVPLRGETVTSHGVTFIVDCYNANPDSVKSALASFAECNDHGRRLIILGDMLELGSSSERYHREIGRALAELTFDYAALVGPMTRHTVDEAVSVGVAPNVLEHFESADLCAERMKAKLRDGDLVYVKGSRGIGLEVIVRQWTGREEEA
ncbi:MAG TPA: UDP-N-acetylmuramoyl-tripeptide--D-alanyl-D-alanine ligase [Acidobacteriota bacterium]|nr:UDP-N-acetylmuramoyl-tripeptide--D-alanyl-D-alanine ligase [Acidobacteriota bacterium]